MNGWMDEWMDGWMDGCTDGGRLDRWTQNGRCADGRTDRHLIPMNIINRAYLHSSRIFNALLNITQPSLSPCPPTRTRTHIHRVYIYIYYVYTIYTRRSLSLAFSAALVTAHL